MVNLFKLDDYKEVIQAFIERHRDEPGYRTRLAAAARCQRSYLSQVLHKEVHLTPDHAFGLARAWRLSDEERDYFLHLVHRARASSPELREHHAAALAAIRRRRDNLSNRYQKPSQDDSLERARYYSSWHYAAVHICLTVPECRSREALARRLRLSLAEVDEALAVLASLGLAARVKTAWHATNQSIHLPQDSPLHLVHQTVWRQRALVSVGRRDADSVHYAAVYSLSRKDARQLKEMIYEFLDRSRGLVSVSPEEEVACFCIDWFKL